MYFSNRFVAAIPLLLGLAMQPSLAQAPQRSDPAGDGAADVGMTIERFRLSAPSHVLESIRVARPLEELARERCDKDAIVRLGKGLQDSGYRRDAATAYVRFSDTCGGVAGSLRMAANILFSLSDYAAMEKVTSDLIGLEPHQDNGYFLRAMARERLGNAAGAIDDYTTSLELYGNKEKISSVSYMALARNYEKLGRYCDAITPIEAWIALNPVRNENSQTRAMISEYSTKGKCPPAKSGEDVFPVTRRGNVVIVPATINGVRGNFIFDTGATFVALRKSFATAAKVEVDEGSTVKLMTANGPTTGKRGRAKSIQLKVLKADDVVVVVQTDDKLIFGDKIDGLLGMSFLSRFNVTMDASTIRVKSRSGR